MSLCICLDKYVVVYSSHAKITQGITKYDYFWGYTVHIESSFQPLKSII